MASPSLYDILKSIVLSPNDLERCGFPTVANLEKGRQQVRNRNKTCKRCKKKFKIDEKGLQIIKENCICLRTNKIFEHHGYADFDPENFVRTKAWPKIEKVFAIDCEMVYTTKGMEAAKVCVIEENGNVIYESFIKPDKMIMNYNTE